MLLSSLATKALDYISVRSGLFWCVPTIGGEIPDGCNIFSLFYQSLTSSEVSTWCDQSFRAVHKMTLLLLAQTSAASCGWARVC
jgi:hypothetical protein